jgi:hypothetical protein
MFFFKKNYFSEKEYCDKIFPLFTFIFPIFGKILHQKKSMLQTGFKKNSHKQYKSQICFH